MLLSFQIRIHPTPRMKLLFLARLSDVLCTKKKWFNRKLTLLLCVFRRTDVRFKRVVCIKQYCDWGNNKWIVPLFQLWRNFKWSHEQASWTIVFYSAFLSISLFSLFFFEISVEKFSSEQNQRRISNRMEQQCLTNRIEPNWMGIREVDRDVKKV